MTESTLYYIHDPMCSWCYAFNASLNALRKHLPPNIQMKYLLGGLAPDSSVPMSVDLQQTIQQNWHRIEQTVPNIRFNFNFWSLNTPYRSTYPACRAVLAARKQCPEFENLMIHEIQTAYYQQAKNPSLQKTLCECAVSTGLNPNEFTKDLNSLEIQYHLLDEIRHAQRLAATSFPSLRFIHQQRVFSIPVNYQNHLGMIEEIYVRLGQFSD